MKKIKLIPLTTAAVLAALVGVNTVNAQEFTKTEIADFAKYELDGEVQYDDVYVIGKYIFKNFITMNDIMNASKDLGDKPNIVYYRNSVTGEWSNVNPEVNETVNITDEDASFEIKVKKDETTQTASGWEYIVLEDPAIISALEAKVAEAEALEAENYTEPSYAVLTEALGMEAGSTDESRQAKIDAITEAISKLVSKADVAELEALKEEVKGLTGSDYLPETYEALISIVEGEEALPETTKEEIDAKVAAINEALEGLKFTNELALEAIKEKIDYAIKHKSDFETPSYLEFVSAYGDVANMPTTTKAEIDSKISALDTVYKLLDSKTETADIDALNSAIDAAEAKLPTTDEDKAKYDVTATTNLENAVNAAKELVKDGNKPLKSQIEKATADLTTALNAFKTAFTNMPNLANKKTEAGTYVESDYTTVSYGKLAGALNLPETTYDEVATKITKIEEAINGLVTVSADTSLKDKIAEAETILTAEANRTEKHYVPSTITELNTAVTNAKNVDNHTSNEAVTDLETAITEKLDGLVFSNAKTLEDLVAEITTIAALENQQDYTEQSWVAFNAVLAEKKPLDLPSATYEEIANKIEKLNELKGYLVANDNSTKLEELGALIAELKKIKNDAVTEGETTTTTYTADSYKVLTDAITEAEKLDENSLLTEIETAKINLNNAQEGLRTTNAEILETLVESAKDVVETQSELYDTTSTAWQTLTTKIASAEAALETVNYNSIKTATTELENAIKALKPKNLENLKTLITDIKTNIVDKNSTTVEGETVLVYSEATINVLSEKITEAEKLTAEDAVVTSKQVADAITAINTAKDALIKDATATTLANLKTAYDATNKNANGHYLPSTYADYTTAMGLEYTNETEALEKIAEIEKAVRNLKWNNENALESAMTTDGLVEEDYTETSWKALTDAIDSALESYQAKEDQTQLDGYELRQAKITAINTAKSSLKFKIEADLIEAKSNAQALINSGNYTEVTVNDLTAAMNGGTETTKEGIIAKTNDINAKIALLESKNRKPLLDLIESITTDEETKLNPEEYTEESWKALTDAMSGAENLKSHTMITEKLESVTEAKKALVFVNLEAFTTLKTNVQTIVDGFEADTTNEAEVALKTALQTAKDADVTTYAKIEAAHQALNDAKIAYETDTATPAE